MSFSTKGLALSMLSKSACLVFAVIVSALLLSISAQSQTVTVTREAPEQYVPGQTVEVILHVQVQGQPRIFLSITEYHPYGWQYVDSTHQPTEIEPGEYLYWEFAPVNDSYTITYTVGVPTNESGARGFLGENVLVYTVEPDFYFSVTEGDNVIYGPDDGDVTATRDMADYYQVGERFPVSIHLDSAQAPQSVTIEETFDASVFEMGSDIITFGGEYIGEQDGRGIIRWEFAFYEPPLNLDYSLQTKTDAKGPAAFEGVWRLKTGREGPIEGKQQALPYVIDQPEPDPEKGCTRTFIADPKIYTPGEPLRVKLEFKTDEDVYGLTVIDRMPKGWTFDSANPEAVNLGQTITWGPFVSKQGPLTMEYTCTPPEDAQGQYIFAGAYAYKASLVEQAAYFPIDGDSIIGDGLSDAVPAHFPIVRDLPDAGYFPGELCLVTLDYDIAEASPPTEMTINESIPDGWVLESADPPVNSTTSRSLRWILAANPIDDGQIEYRLRVPHGEYKAALFTGSYTATSGVEPIVGVIVGDSQVECGPCQCTVWYDEGGVPLQVGHWELLLLLEDIKAGREEAESLFCFQRQWKDWAAAAPTVTPTPTEMQPEEKPLAEPTPVW